MNLIGINGFKRAGKGATAEAVAKLYAGEVREAGFADKLKILAAKTLGYTYLSDQECIALMNQWKDTGWLEGGEVGGVAPEVAMTGRQYLQNLGSEARKVFGDTFWIDMVLPNPGAMEGWIGQPAVAAAMQLRYPGADCLCITDLRYENEAARVKALGGVVWEVVRPGLESDGHDSEQVLPRELVDLVIQNDGTLDDLEVEVEAALETLA